MLVRCTVHDMENLTFSASYHTGNPHRTTWPSVYVRGQLAVSVQNSADVTRSRNTGGATDVGKIHTDGSVKRQRGANYLCIPAKTISYLNKLRKVQCSGVISRCLFRCCRYELYLKHFIFFA